MDIKNVTCSFCNKEQNKVFKLIASPTAGAYICDECVRVCDEILSKKDKTEEIKSAKPSEIKNYLDKFIINQNEAKKVIATSVYNHYKRVKFNNAKSKNVKIEKSNILLIGPTGSGKTLICKCLAEFLNVPFAEVDATTLTEAGYVGDDVESVLSKLLQSADFDVKKAEHGIIYIDEIDKLAKRKTNSAFVKDPTGEGVQQALLKIMEGKETMVPINSGRKLINQETVLMNTENILFICGGAFVGIENIVNKRLKNNSLGFDKQELKSKGDRITSQDLMEYGIIPEFVGRLPLLVLLNELREDDLIKILTEPENSLVKQYKALFGIDGVDVDFKDEFLKKVAKEAYEMKAGARGLRSIFENSIMDIMYTLPDNSGKKIVIDKPS